MCVYRLMKRILATGLCFSYTGMHSPVKRMRSPVTIRVHVTNGHTLV